jgi:hypothetical protein
MGKFRFIKAKGFKDYWIINELVEQCNEEGKDGRFRWCYVPREHVTLPYIEDGTEAKLVVTKEKPTRIIGFYTYNSVDKRLDVLYVTPKMRGKHVALDITDNFVGMFPQSEPLSVLNPCRAVRKMFNKHYPGRFTAVVTDRYGYRATHYEEEDLAWAH